MAKIKELMENKLYKMIAIVIGIVLAFVIIILVVMLLMGGRSSNFSQLEGKIVSAGKKYYDEHSELLPKNIGESSEVDASLLAENKYMKSIDKLSPKGSTCSGKLVVKNVNNNYFYQAFVNCGDSYSTISIGDYIKAHESTVEIGTGLYENGGSYIYRGESPNNYIKFANRIYQIVRINDDSTLDVIATDKKAKVAWDDRYNQERERNDGINDYSVSRVRDHLLEYVNSEDFSDDDRMMMEPFSLCVGKVDGSSQVIYNEECTSTVDNQIIGLLPVSLYTYASLDENCTTVSSGTCSNYNYLSKYTYNWWTMTADSETTYRVFSVGGTSGIYINRAASYAIPRDVIRITNNAVYVEGTGTETNPYVIK